MCFSSEYKLRKKFTSLQFFNLISGLRLTGKKKKKSAHEAFVGHQLDFPAFSFFFFFDSDWQRLVTRYAERTTFSNVITVYKIVDFFLEIKVVSDLWKIHLAVAKKKKKELVISLTSAFFFFSPSGWI